MQHEPGKMSFLDSLMTVGPLSAASFLTGLNITRAPFVTWDEQVWFLIMTPEGVSKFIDHVFDATCNYTLEKGYLVTEGKLCVKSQSDEVDRRNPTPSNFSRRRRGASKSHVNLSTALVVNGRTRQI
ncbi:uncharacterized protein BJ212DRAFT_1301005 [Suillus subaureus]|uniref:Uncharacterized protein n=1 Tax=Suillus subaureus TaxID=48587 RepID=A0A9P7E7Z8_9AGAM|nr:uncharacterized protein BJ212DRAFT_1301005 [Suillus subaureus]KAG1813623.1 hypothetical protein BJ212DRAFT_1301005 [Suillus subaureus]